MIARSIIYAERRIAGEIVIAVARLTDPVGTANDDVGHEGFAGAEITVGIVGGADPLTGGGVARAH